MQGENIFGSNRMVIFEGNNFSWARLFLFP